MHNKTIIEKFYTSFANADVEGMIECYHPKIRFQDPAFGILIGDDAKNMWRMLVERSNGEIKINFSAIQANGNKGSAKWIAEYVFSQTGRNVVNRVSAEFEFEEGLIIRHTDNFDMWKWCRQAIGWKGLLLGWSDFMRDKIQAQTNGLLRKYSAKRVKLDK